MAPSLDRSGPDAAAECSHPVRTRDNMWGFASAETTCAACGEVFDAEQERNLRQLADIERDAGARMGYGKGYVVG